MIPTRVRLIFVVTFILLIAQTLFIKRYGEPYPAVVMPGFEGSGGYADGAVQYDSYEAVFITKDREFSFPPKKLLEEFPDSHHWPIGHYLLMPQTDEQKGQGSRLGRALDTIFPGYAATRRSRSSEETKISLREWLRGRAQVLVPNQPVTRVEIRWFRSTTKVIDGNLNTFHSATKSMVFDLAGKS